MYLIAVYIFKTLNLKKSLARDKSRDRARS